MCAKIPEPCGSMREDAGSISDVDHVAADLSKQTPQRNTAYQNKSDQHQRYSGFYFKKVVNRKHSIIIRRRLHLMASLIGLPLSVFSGGLFGSV